jgi:2-phosphosulfolactate phosphatase
VGKTLVLTTTNGTQAIDAARHGGPLCIGAFSNLSALHNWLQQQQKDVMILCAGWKNRINLEDTIFAGALTDLLLTNGYGMDVDSDAAITARLLHTCSKDDLDAFLENSSHRNRLHKLHLEDDIAYCLKQDTTSVVPLLNGHQLVDVIRQPVEHGLKTNSRQRT